MATHMTSKAVFESTAPTRINIQMKTMGLKFTTETAKDLEPLRSTNTLGELKQLPISSSNVTVLDSFVERVKNITGIEKVKQTYNNFTDFVKTASLVACAIVIFIALIAIKPILLMAVKLVNLTVQSLWTLCCKQKCTLPMTLAVNKNKNTGKLNWAKPVSFRNKNKGYMHLALICICGVSLTNAYRKDVPSIEFSPLTREAAQMEIDTIKELIATVCNANNQEFMENRLYQVTLACALAKRAFNCQCVPHSERIPILHEKNIAKFNSYDPSIELRDQLIKVGESVSKTVDRPSARDRLN